jgi:hypothetical protein
MRADEEGILQVYKSSIIRIYTTGSFIQFSDWRVNIAPILSFYSVIGGCVDRRL